MEPTILAGHVEELAGRIGERNLDKYANPGTGSSIH